MRPANDFTPSVLEAYLEVVDRAKVLHGDPRVGPTGPWWVHTNGGWSTRRVSTDWFLPANVGFRVEEGGRGPVGAAPAIARSWTVGAWNHAGPVVSAEVTFRRPPGTEDIAEVARRVGILPPLIEVTGLGVATPQFMEGLQED